MKKYIEIAEDRASTYQRIVWLIILFNIVLSIAVLSISMAPDALYILITLLALVFANVLVGVSLQFAVDMYKEQVMQRFMLNDLLEKMEQ